MTNSNYVVTKWDFKNILDELSTRFVVYSPYYNGHSFLLKRWDEMTNPTYQFNNIKIQHDLPPLLEEHLQNNKRVAIFGMKRCDLCNLEQGFSKRGQGENSSLFGYSSQEIRKQLFIISSDCKPSADEKGCRDEDCVGYPSSGFDINVTPLESYHELFLELDPTSLTTKLVLNEIFGLLRKATVSERYQRQKIRDEKNHLNRLLN